MNRRETSLSEAETFIQRTDAGIFARINAAIARAHEQNEKPYVYQRPKKAAPKTELKKPQDAPAEKGADAAYPSFDPLAAPI